MIERWASSGEPKLVALYSPVMQSGKSTISYFLGRYSGFKPLSFAGPMKAMIHTLLTELGITSREADRLLSSGKEDQLSILRTLGGSEPLKLTVRHLMQTLGTEWAQHQIHRDFWVAAFDEQLDAAFCEGRSVVVDDLRFPHEYEYLLSRGALIARVDRPSAVASNGHKSEGLLNDKPCSVILKNTGSLQELGAAALSLVRPI
jgi:hypothetical protein